MLTLALQGEYAEIGSNPLPLRGLETNNDPINRWIRPSLTPSHNVGVRPGIDNPLSPDKITNTDPNIIRNLPPTPGSTNKPSGLDEFIDSIS